MDEEIAKHFADIIALAQAIFEHVEYTTDTTPERAILRLKANYGQHRIFVTELLSGEVRKYQYYMLREYWVEAGFDNCPDPRAIRLKYGRIGQEFAGEHIPHLHQENKSRLSLTEEMTFALFIDWLRKQSISI